MRSLIAITIFCLSLSFSAMSQSLAGWKAGYYHYADSTYVLQSADGETAEAQADFRDYNVFSAGTNNYLLGPLTTFDTNLIGDLRFKQITVTAHLEQTGNPIFVWRGWDNSETNSGPATFRLFVSTQTNAFNIAYGNAYPSSCWWSKSSVSVSYMSNVPFVTLTANFTTDEWTDGHGRSSFDYPTEFQFSLAHCGQGGGFLGNLHFFDTGVATKLNTGTARIVINSFEIWSVPERRGWDTGSE